LVVAKFFGTVTILLSKQALYLFTKVSKIHSTSYLYKKITMPQIQLSKISTRAPKSFDKELTKAKTAKLLEELDDLQNLLFDEISIVFWWLFREWMLVVKMALLEIFLAI
jgi:hypothetical protein